MHNNLRAWRYAGTVLLVLFLSACSEVKAFQRGYLAKEEMAWSPDRMEGRLKSHVYFAKEGSSGEPRAAGGGCGCN